MISALCWHSCHFPTTSDYTRWGTCSRMRFAFSFYFRWQDLVISGCSVWFHLHVLAERCKEIFYFPTLGEGHRSSRTGFMICNLSFATLQAEKRFASNIASVPLTKHDDPWCQKSDWRLDVSHERMERQWKKWYLMQSLGVFHPTVKSYTWRLKSAYASIPCPRPSKATKKEHGRTSSWTAREARMQFKERHPEPSQDCSKQSFASG